MKDKQNAYNENFGAHLDERGDEVASSNPKSEIVSLLKDNARAQTKDEFYKRIQTWRRVSKMNPK